MMDDDFTLHVRTKYLLDIAGCIPTPWWFSHNKQEVTALEHSSSVLTSNKLSHVLLYCLACVSASIVETRILANNQTHGQTMGRKSPFVDDTSSAQ